MLRTCVIFLIGLYQRFLSPHKGFRCAHAAWHGGPSCSWAVKDIVREHGVFAGLPRIRLRFMECRAAYASLSSADPAPNRQPEDVGKKPKPRRRRERENENWCLDAATEGACDIGCDSINPLEHCGGCDVGHCG